MGSDKRTFLTIQALRAVAAIAVLAFHCNWGLAEVDSGFNPHSRFLQGTAAGVDIFFVISGLVMMISLPQVLKTARPALTFLTRRLERIVPLYWLITTAILLIYRLAPSYVRFSGSAWHAISSYLFIRAFDLPVLPVGWTLDFEMLFYALFTLALAFQIRPVLFVCPVLAGLAIAHHFLRPAILSMMTDSMILEFAFGMILAVCVSIDRLLNKPLAWFSLAGGAAALMTGAHAHYLPRCVFWGIPALAIVAGAVSLEHTIGRRLPGWLLTTGDASYSLYLIHLPVIWAVIQIWRNLHLHGTASNVAFVIVSGALAFACGHLVYATVEHPIIQRFKRSRRSSQVQMDRVISATPKLAE